MGTKSGAAFDPVAAEGRGEVETIVASGCDGGDESVDTDCSVANGEESGVRELGMEHCE